jgi:HEPN domain-containing protein
MTPQLEEAHRLLRLARRDHETFDLLFPLEKASLAALGFSAQQAAEKSLKAVATLSGIEIQRTHDLAALGHSINNSGTDLPVVIEALRRLNPFAVEYRYNDEVIPSISRDELRDLLMAILDWATKIINASR